jgi:hypothetical protein
MVLCASTIIRLSVDVSKSIRDGQDKLLQINGSKDSSCMVYYQSYEFDTVLEVEDMGFMVGKSYTKPSLKLHLLRLGIQPFYQDVKICDLAL